MNYRIMDNSDPMIIHIDIPGAKDFDIVGHSDSSLFDRIVINWKDKYDNNDEHTTVLRLMPNTLNPSSPPKAEYSDGVLILSIPLANKPMPIKVKLKK